MIGVFDSGVGGLTVLKHIHDQLSEYSTIYLGDAAHSPFGDKTHQEITEYTWNGVRYLFDQGCPLVILACNSASAQALRTIQQTKLGDYPNHRVLGVIRPTIEELAKKYHHIGVLATPATVSSEAYLHEFKKINPELKVSQHACPEWVSIVEEAESERAAESRQLVARDLKGLLDNQPSIEAVLLGCTHYPALYHLIRSELPDSIDLYDQGPLVAKSLIDYLKRHPEIESKIEKAGKRQYLTTGDPDKAKKAAQQFAGMNPNFVHLKVGPREVRP